jgi:hypothetical protein
MKMKGLHSTRGAQVPKSQEMREAIARSLPAKTGCAFEQRVELAK